MLNVLTKTLSATLIASVIAPAAMASVNEEKYTAYCEVFGKPTTCVVVDTRTNSGFLDTRAIYNAKYRYTVKGRFVSTRGYLTWDSLNNKVYKYPYRVNHGLTQVSPDLLIEGVSWD
jgi:hypothetical protein